MRRTRILSTVGPACDQVQGLRALIDAGTDAFRLNFSHGTREGHAAACDRIRRAASESGREVAIVQDLAGPKVRIGVLQRPLDLSAGDSLPIERGTGDTGPVSVAGTHPRVTTTFDALFASVESGARLLFDDGRIEVEVTRVSPDRLDTRVITGGRLESNKGINAPGVVMRTSAMTAKDRDDLAAGLAMGVDLVAVSFVQSASDMRDVREAAATAGMPDVPLIAKIEKPQAVDRIDEILDVSDGLMVARGDLGIEIPLETVPAVQKRLVLAARDRGVPVVLATQVLESMRSAPRPTRAEVTDAAHAVDEGVDAVMLAGETAVGQYPALAVATLDRILREAEKAPVAPSALRHDHAGWSAHGRALCEAAVALAARAGAFAIVAVTEGGRTARILSALRPRARIVAATPSRATAARLALVWGVTPVIAPAPRLPDLRQLLLAERLVPPGAVVVFVAMAPTLGREDANFLHVEELNA